MAQQTHYNDGEPIQPIYFDEDLLAPVTGNTPFGRYENDAAFLADAKKVARWIARRLGYPTVDIEIDERDMYAAFEEAIDQFSAHINEGLTVDNLYTLLGTDRREELTGKFVTGSPVGQMIRLARNYGNAVGSGGDIPWKRASIPMKRGRQSYNIIEMFKEKYDTDRNIIVKRIFHNELPTLQRYFDPQVNDGITNFGLTAELGGGGTVGGAGFTQLSTPSEFVLMPVFTALQRLQHIEFNTKIFRSWYSFDLTGGVVRIYPIPRSNRPLWFDFIYEDEEMNVQTIGPTTSASIEADYGSIERVSSFADAPYDFLRYDVINAQGKRWIWRYALAIAKHKLGMVRSKYDSVPSPQDNFRLDGTELRQQGQQEMEELSRNLRETLERVSREQMIRRNNEEGQQLNEFMNRIPTKIYIG